MWKICQKLCQVISFETKTFLLQFLSGTDISKSIGAI